MTPAPSPLLPGFIALHGNRAEDLAQALIAWLQQHPLAPLEEEIILVQSSGMAEWFKTELACQAGVCAAARVELPGRFIWRTYRQVLGAGVLAAFAAKVGKRIIANAREAGVRTKRGKCRPNAVIAFAPDAQGQLLEVREKTGRVYGSLYASQLDRLLETEREGFAFQLQDAVSTGAAGGVVSTDPVLGDMAAALVVRFVGWQVSLLAGLFEIGFGVFILEPYPTLYKGTVPFCIGMSLFLSGCALLRQAVRFKHQPPLTSPAASAPACSAATSTCCPPPMRCAAWRRSSLIPTPWARRAPCRPPRRRCRTA